MKAFVTSLGEPTTELCLWSLRRNGFDPVLIEGKDSLAQKLKRIYEQADGGFVRVDGDVVPNKRLDTNCVVPVLPHFWWYQFTTFDWYQQRVMPGGVHFITKEAIPILRSNIDKFMTAERPESQLYRLDEFHNPRRCVTEYINVGLHGFGVRDLKPIWETKKRRGQLGNYDFELVERLNKL